MQRTIKKRRRQCETCIPCRSSRKQCDKGNPCRNCSENNRKCLYAKEFPYSNLSQEQQAMILERLLYDTKDKYAQLKMHFKKSDGGLLSASAPATINKNKQPCRSDVEVYEWLRQQIVSPVLNPDWSQNRQPQGTFERNPKQLTLFDDLNKEMMATACGLSEPSDFTIDIARSMVSVEEVDTLIAMYNDCHTFSSLPDFITPHLDENGDYDLLLSSVMTHMCTHAVKVHSMKIDNHQYLSHIFYHYTRTLLTTRMTTQPPDIMCLHTLFNLLLYETENGYLEKAIHTRRSMTTLIDSLHSQYTSLSIWQQSLFRHLVWAIYTSDATRHDLQLPAYIINSSYMQLEKQKPCEESTRPADRLKEEYIYYRCRLADIIRRADMICYQGSLTFVPGQDIKMLEGQLLDLYHDLPQWIVNGQPLVSVQLDKYDGYYAKQQTAQVNVDPCVHSRGHVACQRSLEHVWIRRLKYQLLLEWHSTFLYLYQIFLQPTTTDLVQQLVLKRCYDHGKCIVDLMEQWVDDVHFTDCYCLPILRPLLLVIHVHRSLLKYESGGIRHNSYRLLLKLFSVIQRSSLYSMYKDTAFNWNLQGDLHRNLLAHCNDSYSQGGGRVFGDDYHGDDTDALRVYTTTTS